MKTEVIPLVTNPGTTLTTYLLDSYGEMPNTSVRPAILLCPGGAYRVCSDREGEPVAMAFMAEGYHVFILRYSLNENAAFPKPLQDAEEAIVLIHENAEEWGVDCEKIAACGFSAGGHLAAALGTMGRLRPNALILGYPCILESTGPILPSPVPGLDKEVDSKTPPTFIFSTFKDELVPVENTIRFIDALNAARVPFEAHVFQNGYHGLSLSKPVTSSGAARFNNPAVAEWFELCINWLNSLEWGFRADGDILDAITADDYAEYTIDVPLLVLWRNEVCRQMIHEYFPVLQESPQLDSAMGVSLRVINEYAGKPLTEETMNELDNKFKKIPFVSV